jgi:hypothetical protein
MVYGGAVASGAFAAVDLALRPPLRERSARVPRGRVAGTIGYLIGSIGGWALGDYLGRPWLEHHGRWLHLSPRTSTAPSAGSTAGRSGPCSSGASRR